MSMAGICLLTLGGEMGFHSGDLLCLVCAVCYASYIVFTGSSLCGLNPVAVGVMQFLFMGLYSAAASFDSGRLHAPDFLRFLEQHGRHGGLGHSLLLHHAGDFSAACLRYGGGHHGFRSSLSSPRSSPDVTLGERLGLGQFAGAALMLGGVLWISTARALTRAQNLRTVERCVRKSGAGVCPAPRFVRLAVFPRIPRSPRPSGLR